METTQDNNDLKVRIGIGMGAWPFPTIDPAQVLDMIERWEALDIDSLWLSDHIAADDNTLDPITFMAFVASRMMNMMIGTSVLVLPARNPVILAKELATLDLLSGGRLLPAVGLGPAESRDFEAAGVRKEERGRRTDEAILLMRRLWTEQRVTFRGEFYSVSDVTLTPKPYKPEGPPIWIGGRSEAALRRVGRLGDGWLVSGVTPGDVARGIEAIKGYASEAGRWVPEDHYGVYLPFLFSDNAEDGLRAAKPYIHSRKGVPDTEIAAVGPAEAVRARVREYIEVGATKFVMRPACVGDEWYRQIELLAREVIAPLQTPFSVEERRKRAPVSGG
ncbi:MAG: TIGR03619 family F420-dependent LLM class oxidoreductase [Dehalococcoidia bacterium]